MPNSISEFAANGLRLYPNPASAKVWVSAPVQLGQVEVQDLMGRICIVENHCARSEVLLSLDQLPLGVYVVRARSADGRYFEPQKLVRQ